MQCIQCFPLYKPAVLQRVIKIAAANGAEILLDLEDGISDVNDMELDQKLKQTGRETLEELADFLTDIQHETKLHIRINGITSGYIQEDIASLSRLKKIRWDSVFIPKVESEHCLILASDLLIKNTISFRGLSPIIETFKGYEFITTHPLANICRIEGVFFGNYDYNLDTGQWPIKDQDHMGYRETVTPVTTALKRAGLKFGNSPYAKLSDLKTLYGSLLYLQSIIGDQFYQVSLNLEQTKLCRAFKANNCMSFNFGQSSTIDDSGKNLAHTFLQGKLKGRGFAFNTLLGTMITPHEYKLFMLNSRAV